MNKVAGGILAVVAVAVIAVAAWVMINKQSESPAPVPQTSEQTAPVAPVAPVAQKSAEPASAPEPQTAQVPKPEAPTATPAAPAIVRSIADGSIQAEDFDQGGEGKAYHDTTPTNMYGNYREDGPDIETFQPGSFSIGSIAAGEWLGYTLSVPESGDYDIDFHTATPRTGNQIHVFVNNKTAAANITVPPTTGWGDFQTFTAPESFRLEAGVYMFRLHFPQGFVNIDWFEFQKVNTKWPVGGVAAIRTVWDLTNKAAEGTTVTLKGQSPDNGGRWRAMGVTDANGELNLEFPAFATSAQAQAHNAYSRVKTVDGIAMPPSQPIVIRLERETTLFGTAMFAGSGQPASGAKIEALGANKSATAAADGSWEIIGLDAKSIRLIGSKDDLVSYKDESEIPTIYITAGAPNGPHNLILKEGPMMTGRVTDEETGQPVADAKMSARLMSANFAKVHETKSGVDGRYKIPGLWGDRYTMDIESEEYVPANMLISLGSETRVERDFELEPGATVHATVKDSNGQLLKDAEFTVIVNNNWNSDETKTDEKGQAAIKQISRKQAPRIVARKANYSQTQPKAPVFKDDERETSMEFVLTPVEKKETDDAPKFFVGRITDKEGNPVTDATIRWGQRWSLQTQSETAETDGDGRYRLECKRPYYDYNVLAVTADGKAPAWRTNVTPGAEDSPIEVNFVLDDAHWLNILVVDEQKNPIPDVNISVQVMTQDNYGSLEIPGLSNTARRTDDQGRLRIEQLPGPTVMISASKAGYTSRNSTSTTVDRDETIELKPSGIILGRLLDKETQSPISEFVVKVEGNQIDYERTRKGESISSPDGRFKLSDLALDSPYTLTFTAKDYPPSIEKGVQVARDDAAQEKTFYITKGKGLRIEVVSGSADGQPVAGAEVIVALRNPQQGSYRQYQWDQLESNDWMWKSVERKTTNELGLATFDEGAEAFTIFIKAAGLARMYIDPSARGPYATGEPGQLRVPMLPESVIEGTYTLKGEAQSGQSVNLNRSGNNFHESFGSENTGADGKFEFDSLGAGQYTLNVTKMQGNRGYTSMQKKITLNAGERKQVVMGEDLGPYTLSGRILRDGQPLHNAGAGATNQFNWDYTHLGGQSGTDGVYRIEGLKPGKYSVHVYWHGGGGGEYLNKNEMITIEGDMEKDFEFGGGFKVVAKLKFPETMSTEERGRFRSIQFNYAGTDWGEMQKNGNDTHKSANITGDAIEVKGRFIGKYNLALNYNMPSGQTVSIAIPGSPFELNTLEQDQDLGELKVPTLGGVKFELVFEREQNRDRYNTVSLSSITFADYRAENLEGISQNASSPIAANPISISGRFKGEYRVTVSKDQNTYADSVSAKNTVTIPDPNVETDLGQIVIPAVFDVRGRLIMKDEDRGKYTMAALRQGEIEGPEHNTDGLSRSGSSNIGPDGSFVITGRFRGKHVIAIGADQNISYGQGLSLPQTFEIDNLNGDVDLGDIEITGTGMVKVAVTHSDPNAATDMILAFVMEDNAMRNQFQLGQQPESEIGPLPFGDVTLRFLAPGFKIDPSVTTVTVSEEDTPVVQITTTPEGMLLGMAKSGSNEKLVNAVITLEGAGISRSLTAKDGSLNSFIDIWGGSEDNAINTEAMMIYIFRDLPEGDFTIKVEADGHEPGEGQKHVTPGDQQFDEFSLTLKKIE